MSCLEQNNTVIFTSKLNSWSKKDATFSWMKKKERKKKIDFEWECNKSSGCD